MPLSHRRGLLSGSRHIDTLLFQKGEDLLDLGVLRPPAVTGLHVGHFICQAPGFGGRHFWRGAFCCLFAMTSRHAKTARRGSLEHALACFALRVEPHLLLDKTFYRGGARADSVEGG